MRRNTEYISGYIGTLQHAPAPSQLSDIWQVVSSPLNTGEIISIIWSQNKAKTHHSSKLNNEDDIDTDNFEQFSSVSKFWERKFN